MRHPRRLIGQHSLQRCRQTDVVENKVGAGGIIGTAFAAKRRAGRDTRSIAGSSGPLAIGPRVWAQWASTRLKDFAPDLQHRLGHAGGAGDGASLLNPAARARMQRERARAQSRDGSVRIGRQWTTSHLTYGVDSPRR